MKELTLEQEILLRLLASSLGEGGDIAAEKLACVDWLAVAKESREQAVPLQAFDAACSYREHIPENVFDRWKRLSVSVLARNQQVADGQKDLVRLLNQNGYEYVIIKGTSAAAFYPNPELRALGDIDCLIKEDRLGEVRSLLEREGYTDPNDKSSYDVSYRKGGVELELHYDLPGIPVGEVGERLRGYFSDLVESGEAQSCYGDTVIAPTECKHGVIILLHMVHHLLGGGLGLRHLFDWAAFVKRTANSPFWVEELLPLLHETGLADYAYTMTGVCERYLGLSRPGWSRDTRDSLCLDMILDFFEGGNFGKKDKRRESGGNVLSQQNNVGKERGRIGYLFYTLHTSTLELFPAVKKVPVLYPFVMVWRVVRNIYLQLTGRRVGAGEAFENAEARKRIYDQLKIFRTEEGQDI